MFPWIYEQILKIYYKILYYKNIMKTLYMGKNKKVNCKIRMELKPTSSFNSPFVFT